MYQTRLRWQPVVVLIILALIWGANMAIVKIGAREIPPLFMAALRSIVAATCLYAWMKAKGISIFPSKIILIHGIVVGALFGSEFGLIYVGLQHTTASRTYILLYTAPLFVALGAHLFLKGDRLNPWKIAGLMTAFSGVAVLFLRDIGEFSLNALPGDLMALCAGMIWGSTTVYIKKYLADRTVPLQTLFYQVCFSGPPLFLASILMEDPTVSTFTIPSGFSMFYQCIIVAFLSYLVWFQLIHRHPVSLLHAFSFFTPVFGVFLSGNLILGEFISAKTLMALLMVSLGMVLVNH